MSARIKHINVSVDYKEESVKSPAIVTLLLLILMSVPLVLWIVKINNEGSRANDITKYDALVSKAEGEIRMVGAMLRNDADELEAIRASRTTPIITLIVPEVVIVEDRQGPKKVPTLTISIDGIYWSPNNPLVSVGDETYRVGDIIHGHEIVYIGKTSVHLRAPDGTIVKKDMYEGLLK